MGKTLKFLVYNNSEKLLYWLSTSFLEFYVFITCTQNKIYQTKTKLCVKSQLHIELNKADPLKQYSFEIML